MVKKYTTEQLMVIAIEEMKKSVPDAKRDDNKINPKVGAVLATKKGEIVGIAHRGELRNGDHAELHTSFLRPNWLKNVTLG